jgi:Predicted kinase
MFLMVGLPGAGKTTRAKELAAANRALRLTPDHWMIPLFGDSMADGKRFVLEGRLISVALQALRLGTSVVLDYGLWGRDERSALRWLARSPGHLPGDLPARGQGRPARPDRAPPGNGTAPDVPDERGRRGPMAGNSSRYLTPPNSTAAKSPVRQRGGRAGRSGQQTTGPHAPTANLTILSRAVLMVFVLASDVAGVLSQLSRRVRLEIGEHLLCQFR